MRSLQINDIDFNVVSSYNELKGTALMKVCNLQLNNTPYNQLDVLFYLLGLKWWKFQDLKKWKVVRELPPEWIHTLLTDRNIFGWIFDKPDLTEYKLKGFRLGFKLYLGPVKDILKLNAIEITMCYELFRLYADTKKTEYLDRLIAIIYREINWFWWIKRFRYGFDGDKRVSLSEYGVDNRTSHFDKLDYKLKILIFLQFTSKWDWFQNLERNKLIFPKFDDVNSAKRHDPMAWNKIMMKMAESNVFGSLDQVEKTDKDRFFLNMVRSVEEYLALKDKQKK